VHQTNVHFVGSKGRWANQKARPEGYDGIAVTHSDLQKTVVVTRFFGGIKLGAGGLVRAFTGQAYKKRSHKQFMKVWVSAQPNSAKKITTFIR